MALDGANRTAADRRRILIGKAGSTYQDQRLTLVLRQLVERRAKLLELQMGILRRLGFQSLGVTAVGILNLATPFAIIRAEQVSQDREQPSRQIRTRLEGVDVGKRAQQRFLHEVVGTIAATRKRNSKGAQAWHRRQDVVAE